MQAVARLREFLEGKQEIQIFTTNDFPEKLEEILELCKKTENENLNLESFLLSKNKLLDLFRRKSIRDNLSVLTTPSEKLFLLENSKTYDESVCSKKIEIVSGDSFLRQYFEHLLNVYKNFFGEKEKASLIDAGNTIIRHFLSAAPKLSVAVYQGTCEIAGFSSAAVQVQKQQQQHQVKKIEKSYSDYQRPEKNRGSKNRFFFENRSCSFEQNRFSEKVSSHYF